ncbi:MAG: GntR family transcriptional regulator [Clostridia bacterium]|nr:GntR family transcriptional regulator [Clostridia bacterium]
MSSAPKYMQIVHHIKDCIEGEILKPRDQLPSESELMAEFGVSSITVRKAMETMVREGIVYRVKGKGTYVSSADEKQSEEPSRHIHLIFDIEARLDTSLSRIVQGIQRYYKNKKCLLALENYAFCDEYLRSGRHKEQDSGLILYINSPNDQEKAAHLRKLSQAGVKFVCIDRYLGHFPINYVGCNNHDAVYAAVEHLTQLKHQRIGFLYEQPSISSEKERYKGYVHAMRDFGLSGHMLPPHTINELDACVDSVRKHKVTAIVCANDYTASCLVEALKNNGFSVPKDVSVVGFDDSETYRYHQPTLTTLRQDFHALGYESARVLDKLMTGATEGYTRINIPAQLITRESTQENRFKE